MQLKDVMTKTVKTIPSTATGSSCTARAQLAEKTHEAPGCRRISADCSQRVQHVGNAGAGGPAYRGSKPISAARCIASLRDDTPSLR